ncbi:MAG: VOC family protein [Candidatus Latescibacterota bacterium]|nr:MAG: VOC family protein [Candidatus Latescibacterota bacterium]
MGNPVVHFEVGCRDRAKTQEFYSKLFDWEMESSGPTAMISTGSEDGIDGHITSLGHEPHNYVTFYVLVDDLQSFLDKAESMGGETLIPPTEIPGDEGSFAWLADPDGNIVGLWQPAPVDG